MIQRRWTAACLDKPKTKASKAPVAMSPELAWFLHQWRKVTQYSGDEDWIFPSYKMSGSIPMCAGIFVTDHLRCCPSRRNQNRGRAAVRASFAALQHGYVDGVHRQNRCEDRPRKHAARRPPRSCSASTLRWSPTRCTTFRFGGSQAVGWVWVRVFWLKSL